MNKEELIARYGEGGYGRRLEQTQRWREANPKSLVEYNRSKNRKGGIHYKKALKTSQAGVPGEKRTLRAKHRYRYKPFKDIIAPVSEVHHLWRKDGSAGYSGVALVEATAHRHGIINVIQVLEGEIPLLTDEVRNRRDEGEIR